MFNDRDAPIASRPKELDQWFLQVYEYYTQKGLACILTCQVLDIMTISGGSALNKDEIDRMMREAEQHAEEDKQRREEVEVRNSAEALVYQTEKFLADNGDKIPEDAKANVDGPLAELKAAIEANDLPGMRTATDKVAQASQALGAAMYAQAQQDGTASAENAAQDEADMAEDDVVDAEIVDEGEGDTK